MSRSIPRRLVTRPDATNVVRVTSDCPVIDPALVDEAIKFRSTRDVEFASNRSPADLAAVRAIAELIDVTTAPWREILEVARQHPEIAVINSLETQKELELVDQRWSAEDPTTLRHSAGTGASQSQHDCQNSHLQSPQRLKDRARSDQSQGLEPRHPTESRT